MRTYTFKGGIQPTSKKDNIKDASVQNVLPGKEMIYPLSISKDEVAFPMVVEDEYVLRGQKIAEYNKDGKALYSSVSGYVKKIETRINPFGQKVRNIIIENDEEYREICFQPGYSVEYTSYIPSGKDLQYIVVNCVETDPYESAARRRVIEHSKELAMALELILSKCENAKGLFVLSDDNLDCLEELKAACEHNCQIEIRVVKRKYPQEFQKLLERTILGRKFKKLHVQTIGIEELIACFSEMKYGMPYMERVITVSGDGVCNPGNYKVLLGTDIKTIVNAAGGLVEECDLVVLNGVMNGYTIPTLDYSVTKEISSILCFSMGESIHSDVKPCIQCGRCADVCPAGLHPMKLVECAEKSNEKDFLKWQGEYCISCGCCTYKCPSMRKLKDVIKAMNDNIRLNKENGGEEHESNI